jgi:hypothetical protein
MYVPIPLLLSFHLLPSVILTIRTWVIWKRGNSIAYTLFGAYSVAAITLLILTSLHLKLTVRKPISFVPFGKAARIAYLFLDEAGIRAFSIACNADNAKSFAYLAAAFIILASFETGMTHSCCSDHWSCKTDIEHAGMLLLLVVRGISDCKARSTAFLTHR